VRPEVLRQPDQRMRENQLAEFLEPIAAPALPVRIFLRIGEFRFEFRENLRLFLLEARTVDPGENHRAVLMIHCAGVRID